MNQNFLDSVSLIAGIVMVFYFGQESTRTPDDISNYKWHVILLVMYGGAALVNLSFVFYRLFKN